MKEPDGERRLRWAFGLAVALHAAALGAATQLPDAVGSSNCELQEVRVFGRSTPALVSRVELVEWPAERLVGNVIELAEAGPVVVEPEPPAQQAPERVPAERRPAREPAVGPVAQARQTAGGQAAEPVEPPAVIAPPAGPEAVVAEEPGNTNDAVGSGGGGGGFVDLGSPSGNGSVDGAVSGGTPAGQIPGEGAGTGAGVGPGSGSGTGGGSGSGIGSGEGTGVGEGSGGGGGGFRSRVAERREPEVMWKGTLEYPESAVRDGVEGTVRLEVLVSETGEVLEVEVIESGGDRRLDAAAAEFVGRWRYRPAVQDGEPRRVHTHAKVKFELK